MLQSSTSLEKAQACPVIEDSQDKNFVPKSGEAVFFYFLFFVFLIKGKI